MVNEAGDSLKFDLAVECPLCKQETKVVITLLTLYLYLIENLKPNIIQYFYLDARRRSSITSVRLRPHEYLGCVLHGSVCCLYLLQEQGTCCGEMHGLLAFPVR